MLEKNKQEVSEVNGSVVIQAGGDVNNYGLGYNDVKAISQDVISQYLSSLTNVALDTFKKRIAELERIFIEKLEHLDAPHVEEKLKTPHMQIIMRETMEDYAKSEDANTREELVDLLIERLKVNENDDEKFLIEDAIKVLPSITEKQGDFLAALFFLHHFNGQSLSRKYRSLFLSSLLMSIFTTIIINPMAKYLYHFNELFFIPNSFAYILFFVIIFLFTSFCFFLFANIFVRIQIRKKFYDDYFRMILRPYVYPMKMNSRFDVDHLKQSHCCAESSKNNYIERFLMANETYWIVYGKVPLTLFDKSLWTIFNRQKVISNVDLTPLGVYIGKRIFTKIRGVHAYDMDIHFK